MSENKKTYKRITTNSLFEMKSNNEKISMLTAYDFSMAKVVDKQNQNDMNYIRMSDNFENSLAFKTACDLIFKGKDQPSGYTEPLLHLNRIEKKSSLN